MDILRYTDDFFAMEKELDLFSLRIDEICWWDIARHDVFYLIYHRLSGIKVVPSPRGSLFTRINSKIAYHWLNLKLRFNLVFGRYEVLAFRCPRHMSNGKRVDNILDDVLACASDRQLVINTFPHYYHIRPPNIASAHIPSMALHNLNAVVRERFGINVDVESIVITRFAQHRDALIQYRNLLNKVNPKMILVLQNGIEKALFQAASDRSIPVIEAQHGLIHYVHPAYSYPSEIRAGSLSTLPTAFLAFSQHWLNQCNYPVNHSAVIGNRKLFVHPHLPSENAIVVISANIYEDAIEEVLLPAAALLSNRRFIYKLHPNQYAYRQIIRARFSGLPNISVVGDEQTLQQLMKICSIAFCIQSTGVYEALQAGLRVCLLARFDYETHKDVFIHPNFSLINNVDDLIAAISKVQILSDTRILPTYFQDFDPAVTKRVLNSLPK